MRSYKEFKDSVRYWMRQDLRNKLSREYEKPLEEATGNAIDSLGTFTQVLMGISDAKDKVGIFSENKKYLAGYYTARQIMEEEHTSADKH